MNGLRFLDLTRKRNVVCERESTRNPNMETCVVRFYFSFSFFQASFVLFFFFFFFLMCNNLVILVVIVANVSHQVFYTLLLL